MSRGVNLKITDKTWKFISSSINKLEQERNELENIIDVAGLAIDGPLLNTVFGTHELCITALDKIINVETAKNKDGEESDWIQWYIYENNYGKSELEAGKDNNLSKIKNLDDLRKVIELGD